HHARAGRTSGREGQRFEGLKTIRKALALPLPEGRSVAELRNEAIACLSLPDVEVAGEFDCPLSEWALAIDLSFTRYGRATHQGKISIRRLSDNSELFVLHAPEGIGGYGGLKFSPDGRLLWGFSGDNGVGTVLRLWRFEGDEVREVMTIRAAFQSLSMS